MKQSRACFSSRICCAPSISGRPGVLGTTTRLSRSVEAGFCCPGAPAMQCGGQSRNSGSFSVCASMVEITGMPCLDGPVVQRRDAVHDRLGSGDVQRAGGIEKVELGVDVKEDGRRVGHCAAAAPRRTCSFRPPIPSLSPPARHAIQTGCGRARAVSPGIRRRAGGSGRRWATVPESRPPQDHRVQQRLDPRIEPAAAARTRRAFARARQQVVIGVAEHLLCAGKRGLVLAELERIAPIRYAALSISTIL